MSKVELIRAYYEYNEYANNRLLEFASKLSDEEFSRTQGASFDSVEGNLAHIFAAQTVWLGRWKDLSNVGPLEDVQSVHGLQNIREAFATSHAELREFIGGLTDARLDEVLAYQDSRGTPYKRVLWQLMLHVGTTAPTTAPRPPWR